MFLVEFRDSLIIRKLSLYLFLVCKVLNYELKGISIIIVYFIN